MNITVSGVDIVNMNRVRPSIEGFEVRDIVRERLDEGTPSVCDSMERALAEAQYGAWYVMRNDDIESGPHMTKGEAARVAREADGGLQ